MSEFWRDAVGCEEFPKVVLLAVGNVATLVGFSVWTGGLGWLW